MELHFDYIEETSTVLIIDDIIRLNVFDLFKINLFINYMHEMFNAFAAVKYKPLPFAFENY